MANRALSLKSFLVIKYPRLNLNYIPCLDLLGTMHLFCTNIIMWIRIVLKESQLEINHALHDSDDGEVGGMTQI
jgi:hypothetical protein